MKKQFDFLFFSLIAIVLSLSACSSPRQAPDANPMKAGYRLIDDGKADEAIDHFRALLDQDPSSDECRRGLSAAYALRGGFRVPTLATTIKEIENAKHVKSQFEDMSEFDLDSNTETLHHFAGIVAMQIEVVVFLKSLKAIRSPTKAQVEDLKSAIDLLHYLKSTTQSDFLYMGILDALVLRFEVQQLGLSFPAKQTCDDWLQTTQGSLLKISGHYGRVLTYLSQARPSQKEAYQKQIEGLEDVALQTAELTNASLTALSVIQIASDNPDLKVIHANSNCKN